MAAFQRGLRNKLLIGKFSWKPPRTVKEMFDTANYYAKSDEAVNNWRQDKHQGGSRQKKNHGGGGGNGGDRRDRKRKLEDIVATTSSSQQR